MQTQIYAILSVLVVSLISLVGVFIFSYNSKLSKSSLKLMVSFAIGALLGDVFIHLLPELAEQNKLNFTISLTILGSIVGFFVTESFIHWHHHHNESDEEEHAHHPVAFLNLIGDGLHNFIDGLIIGGAYLIDIQAGVATTIAVILHEIPQEIGDFGVLIYAGFTKSKAVFYNFLSALTALVGVLIALYIGQVENFATIMIAIGIGSFIYISLADLVPEIHKSKSWIATQFLAMLGGIAVMLLLLLLE
jgi:zinc and cadmium transporter